MRGRWLFFSPLCCKPLSISAAGRLRQAERPARQLTTGLQRQDDVGTADIGDEVASVLDWGLREPLATLSLIGAYPFDAALQSSVVRRDTEFSRDDNDQARAVAVTFLGAERLAVVPSRPFQSVRKPAVDQPPSSS